MRQLWQAATFVFLAALASPLYGQSVVDPYTASVGPAYGYTATGSREVFRSIAGKPETLYYPFGGGIGQPEDDGYASLSLPFNFRFFGNTITAGNPLFASANGFVVFGTSSTTVVPTNLSKDPASFGNQPAISPLFNDLVARGMQMGGPGLYVQVAGIPGEQTMTIEWSSMQHFNNNQPTSPVSFQIKLFEKNGMIVFNYESTIFGTEADQGGLAAVGIRDTTFEDPPTNVLQWGFHNGNPVDGDGLMLGGSDFRITFGGLAAVPEPTSVALISVGLTGVAGRWWWRRRKALSKTRVTGRR
ncbi:MAG: PEP-CTERM sorting domain-containing protein [Gemmatales bacterium]